MQRDDRRYQWEREKENNNSQLKREEFDARKQGLEMAYGKTEHAGIKASAELAYKQNQDLFKLKDQIAPNSSEYQEIQSRIDNNNSVIDKAVGVLSQNQKKAYDFGTINGVNSDTYNVPKMDDKTFKRVEAIRNQYGGIIDQAAQKTGLDAAMITAIINTESRGHVSATSPAGAKGLMQMMPTAAQESGLTVNATQDDRLDPVKNVQGGSSYYASLLKKYGDRELALAAYNYGTGALDKKLDQVEGAGNKRSYQAVKELLPTETQKYVPAVMNTWRQLAMDKADSQDASKQVAQQKIDEELGRLFKTNDQASKKQITENDFSMNDRKRLAEDVKKAVQNTKVEDLPEGYTLPAESRRKAFFYQLINEAGKSKEYAFDAATSSDLKIDADGNYLYDGKKYAPMDLNKTAMLQRLQQKNRATP